MKTKPTTRLICIEKEKLTVDSFERISFEIVSPLKKSSSSDVLLRFSVCSVCVSAAILLAFALGGEQPVLALPSQVSTPLFVAIMSPAVAAVAKKKR
jgi:hypothetical protein